MKLETLLNFLEEIPLNLVEIRKIFGEILRELERNLEKSLKETKYQMVNSARQIVSRKFPAKAAN